MFKLTELGTMRGDDGGAPRGLRAHQKTLRNKDQDHTPTDAPKWEPKPRKTPSEPGRERRAANHRPAKDPLPRRSHTKGSREQAINKRISTTRRAQRCECQRFPGRNHRELRTRGRQAQFKGCGDPTAIEVKGCQLEYMEDARRHGTGQRQIANKKSREKTQKSGFQQRSSSKGAGAARNRRTKSQNKNVERKNTNIGERGNSQLARERVC